MNKSIMPSIENDLQEMKRLSDFLAHELPVIKTAYDGGLSTDGESLAMLDKLELLVLELANRTHQS